MPEDPTQPDPEPAKSGAPPPPQVPPPPGDVPTFESIRDKIETRYGAAQGAAELDAETPQGRTVAEQYQARQRAAAERLDQIRASMREDQR